MESKFSMSSLASDKEKPVETLFAVEVLSSSTEPPMEEWSSLIIPQSELNMKLYLIEQGLCDPGSGEVCAKYLALSDSSVIRHPYYKYPAILDPGIVQALCDPEPKQVCDDQQLYVKICNEMGIPKIREFYNGLVKEAIDLRYYCVSSASVRSMCLALESNQVVRRLDLSSSFLDLDAWYHLGWLLGENRTLKELVFCQCRMGPKGLQLLVHLLDTVKLDLLDLSKNELGNEGIQYLTDKLLTGARIRQLNLSYNDLNTAATIALADALKFITTSITHLDLSWNQLFEVKGLKVLVEALKASTVLKELNLSWNNVRNGPIAELLSIPTLERLDLSNNKLSAATVTDISTNLTRAKNMKWLNMSYNPLGPKEVYQLLLKMRLKKVHLKTLMLDGIPVTKEFEDEVKNILSKKFKQGTVITHGKVMNTNALQLADMRDIVMKRMYFLGKKGPKKKRIDVPVYFLTKHLASSVMIPKEMLTEMKQVGCRIDEDLINQMGKAFPGPRIDKTTRAIDLDKVVDYLARKWPNAKPKEPEPPAVAVKVDPKANKGKGNKEKDKGKEKKKK